MTETTDPTATPIKHGTLRSYVIRKCRCPQCNHANRVYNNEANRLRAYGQWEPYVDAQPARDHVRLLAEYGIGHLRVATLAGISSGPVSRLLYGMPGRPPTRRIRPETHAKILAVRPILDNLADFARTDGTGARRRLQALTARGFTGTFLAARLGMEQTNLSKLLRADGKLEAVTVRAVFALYDELWNADPAVHGIARGASTYARTVARKYGWLVPMAWGEEIDDPMFVPDVGDDMPQPLVIAENVEFIRRTTEATDEQIAERLGISRDVLQKNLARARRTELTPA